MIDDREIIETLARNSAPQTILDLRPSDMLQARVSELLARNKEGKLSSVEELEVESYLTLEHWIRLAKGRAYQQLSKVQ